MKPVENFVGDLLAPVETKEAEFSRAQLADVWAQICPPEAAGDAYFSTFEEAFLQTAAPDRHRSLAFGPGGWTVKVSEASIKTGLTTALLTTALVASGSAGIPALVIPAVLPLFFDVEKVRLSKSEEGLLAQLTLREDARSGTADELYARLPDDVREDLSKREFTDFLEKCRRAGLADESESGSIVNPDAKFTLRDQAKFRVTIV